MSNSTAFLLVSLRMAATPTWSNHGFPQHWCWRSLHLVPQRTDTFSACTVGEYGGHILVVWLKAQPGVAEQTAGCPKDSVLTAAPAEPRGASSGRERQGGSQPALGRGLWRGGPGLLRRSRAALGSQSLSRRTISALAGVVQWIECWPMSQRVTSSIPSQDTCLGCGPGPQWGAHKRQPHMDVSLLLFPPLSSSQK